MGNKRRGLHGWKNFEGFTAEEKKAKCQLFYKELVTALRDSHENVKSCNRDDSAYLVPKGTSDQITYESKPINSFRISDHWNWKANLEKNQKDGYIQCYTKDVPVCKARPEPGKASPPIWAWQVGYFGEDKAYHCVYGEVFNRESKTWYWLEGDVDDVIMQFQIQK